VTEPPKRRLPVLPSTSPSDEEERPPWHWSGIGLVAIFLAWLPLAAMGNVIVKRMLGASDPGAAPAEVPARVRVSIVVVSALGFVVAAFAGGYLVGRFGGKAGPKQAGLSGLAAALLAWAIALAQPGGGGSVLIWMMVLVVMSGLGGSMALLGGRAGLRGRR
jgi:hypothetical protein